MKSFKVVVHQKKDHDLLGNLVATSENLPFMQMKGASSRVALRVQGSLLIL